MKSNNPSVKSNLSQMRGSEVRCHAYFLRRFVFGGQLHTIRRVEPSTGE
jgi:hypothetical protein